MAAPTCPRCDYDLSGLVATWTAACPMQAMCSECGLVFDCPNVLSPRHIGPPWSFEHGPGASLVRFLRSSWAAIRPWRLCTELRIDHAVRAARLAWFIVLWLAAAHLLLAAGRAWLANMSGFWSFPGNVRMGRGLSALMDGGFWEEFVSVLAFPYIGTLAVPQIGGKLSVLPIYPVFLWVYMPTVMAPLWMMFMPGRARGRRIHLLRALAYTVPAAAAFSLASSSLIIATLWTRGPGGPGPLQFLAVATLLAFPVYHATWWWWFIRKYLGQPRAVGAVVLIEVLTGLAIAGVIAAIAAAGGDL